MVSYNSIHPYCDILRREDLEILDFYQHYNFVDQGSGDRLL